MNYVVKVSDTSQLYQPRSNVYSLCQYHCRWYLPPKRIERKDSLDFKVNITQTKISEISIWNVYTNIFQNFRTIFWPLKIFVKKLHPDNASGQLRGVICSNLKHCHSCSLGDWENNEDTEIQTAAGCAPAYEYPKKW